MNSIPNQRTRFSRVVSVAASILLLLGVALSVAIYFLPRVYFAKVIMEVKPDGGGPIMVFWGSREDGDRAFVARQLSLLQSREILDQVIKNLLLDVVWAKDGETLSMEQTSARLLRSLELRDVDGKGLIEIGAYSTDPQEAANIANTMAIVYQQKRLVDLQRLHDRGLEQLRDEVEKQRLRADADFKEAAAIRERDGIVDPNPNDYSTSLDSQKGKESLNAYVEVKTRALQTRRIFEAAKTKLATELLEREVEVPGKILEAAQPPIRPVGFNLQRLRHAFR